MPARFKVQTTDVEAADKLKLVPGIIVDSEELPLSRGQEIPTTRNTIYFGLCSWPIVRAVLPELLTTERPVRSVELLTKRAAQMRDKLRAGVVFKDFQAPGIRQLIADECGLLRWPPGAGKTLAGLATLLAFPAPRIIVTLASNREGYVREIAKWTTATCQVLTGYDNGGVEIDPIVDFIITSVETLQWQVARLVRCSPKSVLFDESDLVKNNQRFEALPTAEGSGVKFVRKNNRSAAALDLSLACTYRFESTATPMPNKPIDLYAQGDLLEPMAWGHKTAFAKRYANRLNDAHGHVNDDGSSNLEELRARWSMISHEVSDAQVQAEMPPVRVEAAFIAVEDQTRAEKKDQQSIDEDGLEVEELPTSAPAASGLMQAALASRGYVTNKVLETVRAGYKAVVFTGWRADAERTATALCKKLAKLNVPVVCIHGGNTTSSNRLEALRPFIEAPAGALLVATMAAAGRALDGLQVAAYAVFQMLPFTIGQLEQAVGRFPRLGRTIPCLIELCVPLRTYAETVASMLLTKSYAVAAVTPTEIANRLPSTLLSGAGAQRAFDQICGAEDVSESVQSAQRDRVVQAAFTGQFEVGEDIEI